MDQVLESIAALEEQVAIMKTAATDAKEAGKIAYPKSKAIRAAALESAKICKGIRETTLEAFKGQSN